MTQDIEELPSELTRALFQLGGRTLVFVEGETDETVFKKWFQERLQDVLFYPAGGVVVMQERLRQLATFRPDVQAYGIRDRDFCDDATVQAALGDATARLFLLTRYSIENYLLEPQALLVLMDDFLGPQNPVKNAAEVEGKLLELCHRLHALMGANWLLIEEAKTKLSEGDNRIEKERLIQHLAHVLGCPIEEAENRLDEKMALIQPKLHDLEMAHTQISGKPLLHHFYKFITASQGTLRTDHAFRFLVRHIKENLAIHPDLRFIVEKRILGDP